MLLSVRRQSRNALALIALFASFPLASSAATPPDDYVTRDKQFIWTLYPGLNPNLRVVVTDTELFQEHYMVNPHAMNQFFLDLADTYAPSWCSSPALRTRFLFDPQTEYKELIDMYARGPAIDAKGQKVAGEIYAHPEWTEQQVAAALNRAGAKFGPDHKADFLRALPIEQLQPYVAGELEVVSAEFLVQREAIGEEPPTADLFWRVETKWHRPEGLESQYTLTFEPFAGKLLTLSGEGPHKRGDATPK